jgi:recombinational DNA repair protein RecR
MFEGPVQRLIDELARLPGVGQKSAQRLAFHLLSVEDTDARRLAAALTDMRDQVSLARNVRFVGTPAATQPWSVSSSGPRTSWS